MFLRALVWPCDDGRAKQQDRKRQEGKACPHTKGQSRTAEHPKHASAGTRGKGCNPNSKIEQAKCSAAKLCRRISLSSVRSEIALRSRVFSSSRSFNRLICSVSA